MSDIDVHEIKLDLRYPNSRQEDITDAFMRGYQGAVKIGNDAVRRVKAEKEALERRIDELCQENERLRKAKDTMHGDAFEIGAMLVKARHENAKLCAEVERLHAEQAHWELGNCPSCPNIADLQEALEQNAKLREELDAAKHDLSVFSGELVASKFENAKLRELVRIAVIYCDSGTCDGCPIMGKDESCPYADMARELGIEVDG